MLSVGGDRWRSGLLRSGAGQTTINISMPGKLGEFVRARVEGGGYGNTSEYFRELVRQDQKRGKEQQLEGLLLEGLDSGPPVEVSEKWWADLRRDVEALRRKKRKKSA